MVEDKTCSCDKDCCQCVYLQKLFAKAIQQQIFFYFSLLSALMTKLPINVPYFHFLLLYDFFCQIFFFSPIISIARFFFSAFIFIHSFFYLFYVLLSAVFILTRSQICLSRTVILDSTSPHHTVYKLKRNLESRLKMMTLKMPQSTKLSRSTSISAQLATVYVIFLGNSKTFLLYLSISDIIAL